MDFDVTARPLVAEASRRLPHVLQRRAPASAAAAAVARTRQRMVVALLTTCHVQVDRPPPACLTAGLRLPLLTGRSQPFHGMLTGAGNRRVSTNDMPACEMLYFAS